MQSFSSSPSRSNVGLGDSPLPENAEEASSESPNNKTDSSILSVLANQFVSEASNIPKRLYCPFCLFDFGFDFLLKSHIRELHVLEIKKFSQTKLDSFTFDPCCFCHAKFYVRGLLPKHIIRKHHECILALISKANPAGGNQHVCCKYCAYKVSVKQLKLLFIHMENKHLTEFVKTLSVYNANLNGHGGHEQDKSVEDCVLNEEIRNLSITEPAETVENLKPILKRGSLYDGGYQAANVAFEQDWAPRTRRKLRFDLPDLSLQSAGSDKENVSLKTAKSVFGLKIKNAKGKPKLMTPNKVKPEPERNILRDITSSTLQRQFATEDGVDNLEALPFKCGICSLSFDSNSVLVHHVKRIHGRINFQARYRCGMCKAKFYRNSYLVRHSNVHARPKCLATYEYKP